MAALRSDYLPEVEYYDVLALLRVSLPELPSPLVKIVFEYSDQPARYVGRCHEMREIQACSTCMGSNNEAPIVSHPSDGVVELNENTGFLQDLFLQNVRVTGKGINVDRFYGNRMWISGCLDMTQVNPGD